MKAPRARSATAPKPSAKPSADPPTSPAVEKPPEGVAAEIRALAGSRLKGFYAPRGYWPLWLRGRGFGPATERFLDLLDSAERDGLDPKDYDAKALRKLVAETDATPKALARAEIRLSGAFAAYVRDMRVPRAKITYLDAELEPRRLRPDLVLRRAALAPSFADYVRTMGWMNPLYVDLRTAIGAFDTRWSDLPQATIGAGPILKAGTKGQRVRLLRRRLGLPDGAAFDAGLAAKLRAYQADHGLPAQGIAGPATIAALDAGEGRFDALLRLNLERARLLPDPRLRHVVVNAAAARLWYYGDGMEQGTMRVVVGTPETPTPMMAGMVRYAILNPYWNVPADLVEKRIAPKMAAGGTFAGYQALSGWDAGARQIEPASIDWHAVAAGDAEVRVRQLPGGGNAMGRVKFMFPNNLGIYLHDTPDKALMAKPARQFSNGCVRLEDAPRLGAWLLGQRLALASDVPEQQQPLEKPVPVFLTYLTAMPSDGGIAFLPDVYGRDGKIGIPPPAPDHK